MLDARNTRVGIMGLGYVGLPLASAFGSVLPTIAYDVDTTRTIELAKGEDRTREVDASELAAAIQLDFSSEPDDLRLANFYVVTVPTPLNADRSPDLEPLRRASETVGRVISEGDVVVYESTVYPGATEEVCIPIVERVSGLVFNRDFYAGYSPERINPGDRSRRITDIPKVVSGSTPEASALVGEVYRRVIRAGTFKATSIRVAEAAKVIENTQRCVNIALINELAMLFGELGLDTHDVLEAAATKWNFLPFKPGLVGGHCIGVDPYYLIHKASEVGSNSEVVLAGCRANDRIGTYVADRIKSLLENKQIAVDGARVLVLGLTFKENCPDVRNTRVVDILARMRDHGMLPETWDPQASTALARSEYGLELIDQPEQGAYDAVVLAVAHREFAELGAERLRAYGKNHCVVYDIKGILPHSVRDERL